MPTERTTIANHLDSCDTLQPIQSRLLLGLLLLLLDASCCVSLMNLLQMLYTIRVLSSVLECSDMGWVAPRLTMYVECNVHVLHQYILCMYIPRYPYCTGEARLKSGIASTETKLVCCDRLVGFPY